MRRVGVLFCLLGASFWARPETLPPNQWVELRKDPVGARRGSAIRYAPRSQAFFLWGFMNDDPDLLQENPLMEIAEYDMVYFNPEEGRWRSHLPPEREAEWSKKLPLAYIPRTYSGITTGSERTVLRAPTDESEGVPRPDLNIVFDQVAYDSGLESLIYFTGGLTAAYRVADRRWFDLAPTHSPPPVVGGSLAYDSSNDEIVLFGGGHVAERSEGGKIVGYTGTWVFSKKNNDWRRLALDVQPPPRMNARLVCDTRNQVLVVFGGDGQSHYLSDTWLYNLRSRTWRKSKASGGPEARAGHFTVFDPDSGWVIIGGGYNQRDLTDMWAYDAAEDDWRSLAGGVPTGIYITADISPERRLIVLVTNTRKPGDIMTCNVLYPVRTTYGYRIHKETIVRSESLPAVEQLVPKRPPTGSAEGRGATAHEEQSERVESLPLNRWVRWSERGRIAPVRTWGSATFDTDREQILYWGGGHCGFGGNDVDSYDPDSRSWRSLDPAAEHPERTWDKGVRLAGVTFQGKPWTEHGRRIYAYDPLSRKMIMTRRIRLTMGYEPELLRDFPATGDIAPDALVNPPSSYVKFATWTFDPDTGHWDLIGPAPLGVDTLVTTRHGVMGVNVNWPSRLNDAGYLLPWRPSQPLRDTAIFLLEVAKRSWTRLSEVQPSPQNLYEMTSLAYDSRRDRVILHGGGQRFDELWIFDIPSRHWISMRPLVTAPPGAPPPVASREAVYLPQEDVFLTYGPAPEDQKMPALWAYSVSENGWRRLDVPPMADIEPEQRASQNRALVYDPKRDLVLLVLGTNGDDGDAVVYAMRYRQGSARFLSRPTK